MALRVDPAFNLAFEPLVAAMQGVPIHAVGDVAARRIAFESFGALIPKTALPPTVKMEKMEFESFDGQKVPIYRVYSVSSGAPTSKLGSAILHYHGGGYIAGNVEQVQASIAKQVEQTGVQLFSVDYRLAPEFPYPTPVEDCYAGLRWVLSQSERFGVDPARIGVQGESAGGGLAAATAILARDRKLDPPLAKQILIYPMMDDRTTKDLETFNQYIVWKLQDNQTGWKALLGDLHGTDSVPASAAAARLTNFQGLPSTYVDTGSLDLFADENTDFVAKLVKANADVEFHLYPGLPHAFEMLTPQLHWVKLAEDNRRRAITSF